MKKGLPSQPKLVGLVVAELPAVSRPAARPLVCRNPFQLHSLQSTVHGSLSPLRLPSNASLLTSHFFLLTFPPPIYGVSGIALYPVNA
jgi:hypothetical protein